MIVIGAGVAGLTCARELAARNVRSLVLERELWIGGRCTTRLLHGQLVDPGLPFLHANSWEFRCALRDMGDAGKVPGWPVRVPEHRLAGMPDAFRRGHRRMARREGVVAFPKHLARGLDVSPGSKVVALEEADGAIEVVLARGKRIAAPFVVLACELTSSLALVEPIAAGWDGASTKLGDVRAVRSIPGLSVIAGYPLDAPEPSFDLWFPLEATMLHAIAHDSAKRNDPRWRVMVYHGKGDFSREHFEDEPARWSEALLWEAAELLGDWAALAEWTDTQRWESARLWPGESCGRPMTLESQRGGVVALCGDAFAEDPGLEGAYLSGISLAEQIGTLPRVRRLATT